MSQGSVTIAADGTETKSGLAGAMYDARIASIALVEPPGNVPSGPEGVQLKRGIALDANAIAAAVYPEIVGALPSPTILPGHIAAFAMPTAPTGWLLCDGASYLRATYAGLFAIIGTTFGAVDGTHFNVPTIPDLGVGIPYVVKT